MFEQITKLRLSVESEGVDKAKRDLEGLGKTGKATEQSLEGTNKTSKGLSKSLVALGLSVGGVALAAKKVLGDWSRFNNAMLEVETIAGSTKAEMKALRLEALRLAQSLGVDAADAAGGFYQAISAGVATEDVAEFTKVAAQLAKGGLSDVASSTDLLTTALNAYKIEASEAESISDKLFKTVQLGKTNIPQLASSFGRAATAAAQSGVDINELLGIVAETTKQGVKTAEVFTMVKAAITALLNPSEDMAAIYQELGVASGRQLIASRGLAGALEAVRNATAGNDAVTVKALRSVEAFSLAMSVTGDNIDNVRRSTKEITEAMGDTARASETTSETVGVAFKKLGNSFLILSENIIKAIDADLKFGEWVSSVADTLADEEVGKAFGQSLQNYFSLGTTAIIRYQEELKKAAEFEEKLERLRQESSDRIKARRGDEQDALGRIGVLQFRVQQAQQRIAEIEEGRKSGATRLPENLLLERRELEKQIKLYEQRQQIIRDTIAEKGRESFLTLAAKEQIASVNNEYQKGNITLTEKSQRIAEINAKLKDNIKNGTEFEQALGKADDKIKSVLTSIGKFSPYFDDLNEAARKFVDAAKKYNEKTTAQIEINKIVNKYENEKEQILKDQIKAIEKKIELGDDLTGKEQGILNFLRKQLGVLQEQNKERSKSTEQLDFEGLVASQMTDRERAAKQYAEELQIIKNYEGNITAEQKQQAELRAQQTYEKALERADQAEASASAVPQAIDEQTSIDEQAEALELRYGTELERLKKHLEDERNIIREATNLTGAEKNALLARIDEQGAQERKAIQREELNQKLDATRQFFGGMSALASSFGKKGFKAAQAFAIAEATINTFQGATKALATYPPPFNFIAAAGVVATGLAQVAQIRSQQPPSYQQGGIVDGTLYGGDQELARVNSGEMILNKTQQGRLFAMANNPLSGSNKSGNVTIVNNAPVQLEGDVQTDRNGDMKIIIAEAVQQTKIELTNEAQEGGGNFFPTVEQSYGLKRTPR